MLLLLLLPQNRFTIYIIIIKIRLFAGWMDVLTPPPPAPVSVRLSVSLLIHAMKSCHESFAPFAVVRSSFFRKCVRNSRLQIVIKFDYQAPQGGIRISGNR